MPTERSFIDAIHADPTADAPRLIFADWLEERGDERAELLRGETELSRLPLTDARYPQLRQRVVELRTRIDAEWAIAAAFRQIRTIDDLVYYLRWFHRSWTDTPGLDPATLPKDLPPGLALIYRELGGLFSCGGGRGSPFSAQDRLASPAELEEIDGMIEFAWENQGCWSCRYPLGQDDPPVYSDSESISSEEGLKVVCNSLNHFLITFCLQEAVLSAPCSAEIDEIHASPPLTVACRPLWLSGRYVSSDTVDFYDVPGKDVLFVDGGPVPSWLGSHSEQGLKLIRPGVHYYT